MRWTTQFLPVLRTYDLLTIVDGSEICHSQFVVDAEGKTTVATEYSIWQKKDQFILAWLNATLTDKVLSSVLWAEYISRQVWDHLANKFVPHSRTHITSITNITTRVLET